MNKSKQTPFIPRQYHLWVLLISLSITIYKYIYICVYIYIYTYICPTSTCIRVQDLGHGFLFKCIVSLYKLFYSIFNKEKITSPVQILDIKCRIFFYIINITKNVLSSLLPFWLINQSACIVSETRKESNLAV